MSRESNRITCRKCGGSGKQRCPECHGKRTVRDGIGFRCCRTCEGIFSFMRGTGTVTCDGCNGRGSFDEYS